MQNIKMTDVAKAAGVSLATVGRVIHNNGYVSESNREKINKAIEDLGYVPNKMARSLKSNHSKMLGHFVIFNENMLYARIGSAINEAAAENGYSIFTLTAYRDSDDENALIDEFISRKVDGVIITSNDSVPAKTVEKLIKLKIPTLMIERAYDLPMVDRVLVNDVGGAQRAVEELISKGKKSIGYIGRMSDGYFVEEDRKVGYINALEQSKVPFNEKLMAEMDSYSCESGYLGAKLIYENGEIPLLNDSANCIAPISNELFKYANNLKLSIMKKRRF